MVAAMFMLPGSGNANDPDRASLFPAATLGTFLQRITLQGMVAKEQLEQQTASAKTAALYDRLNAIGTERLADFLNQADEAAIRQLARWLTAASKKHVQLLAADFNAAASIAEVLRLTRPPTE